MLDFIVNTDVTRLIPAYTTPTEGDKGHNLLLSSKHVQDLRWQYLGSAEGQLHILQDLRSNN